MAARPRWQACRRQPTQARWPTRRKRPTPPIPRSRVPRDSRDSLVTRRMSARRPMRPTPHARTKRDAWERPPMQATHRMTIARPTTARRARQRQAVRRERKSTPSPRATHMRRLRGDGNAALQIAAPGGQESYVRSHRPIRHAAACCCERRIFRASHRHVRRIACARRRRLFAAEPFADPTRALRWRLMSRQAPHFTRPYANRLRCKSRFHGVIALRHALFQLVAARVVGAWQARVLTFRPRPNACALEPVRSHFPVDSHNKATGRPDGPNRKRWTASHACRNEPYGTRAHLSATSRWFRARCPSCAAPSIRLPPSRSPSRPR